MRNVLVVVGLVFVLSSCATPPAATSVAPTAAATPVFDGTWEGALSAEYLSDRGQSQTLSSTGQFRLVIAGARVSVFGGRDADWRELKPGKFRLQSFDTNAIVTSIDTGRDKDGVWVESLVFALTVIDGTQLHAVWTRQVKNKDWELSRPQAFWGLSGQGRLTRAADVTP